MPVGLRSGRVWRNSIFSLFPNIVDIYAELLLISLVALRRPGLERAFQLILADLVHRKGKNRKKLISDLANQIQDDSLIRK